MRRRGMRAAVLAATMATVTSGSIGVAGAAPDNKNSSSPGTATCEQFDGPLRVTFNRSEKTPVTFVEGHRIALVRYVEGTFELQIVDDGTVLFTSEESFAETVANGVQRGMQITRCTFDFYETEDITLSAEIIAEFNEFGAELDESLVGEEVTFVYASEGFVLAQIVGRR